MPTEKRQRKKEGRQARQEAVRAAQRRADRRRRIIVSAVVVALFLAVVFVINAAQGDKGKKVTSTASSTTAAANKNKEPAKLTPVKDGASVTGDTPCPKADGSSERTTKFAKPPPTCIDTAKTYTATIDTSKGTFTVALDAKRAPKTVNNFVVLARYHFFDGIAFHRIIPGFVVQGGDPTVSGSGGPGYTFADELPKAGEYKLGSLAMANSGPDTNGSQFFVITGDQGVALQPNYSLFGQVSEGMDVVKKIEAVGTAGGSPTEAVVMKTVTIKEA